MSLESQIERLNNNLERFLSIAESCGVPPGPASTQPPVDNEHVAEGAEQFSEPEKPAAEVAPKKRGRPSRKDTEAATPSTPTDPIATTVTAPATSTANPTSAPAPASTAEKLTLEKVRASLLELQNKKGAQSVMRLLKDLGYASLSVITEDKYPGVIAEAQKRAVAP